jgi:putative FmdB family regulatory protein
MPLYEYQCDACSHRFERIQKFSDPLIDVCPSCGGTVKKLLSSPAIQFKGSGWYITDYAKKSSSKDSKDFKDDGKGSASTPTGDSKASEKTPAAGSPSESPASGKSGGSSETGGTGSSSGS